MNSLYWLAFILLLYNTPVKESRLLPENKLWCNKYKYFEYFFVDAKDLEDNIASKEGTIVLSQFVTMIALCNTCRNLQ